MYFLAVGEVCIIEYMEDVAKKEAFIELVQSHTKKGAEEAMEKHYKEMSDEFGTSYQINYCQIKSVIR